MMFDMSWYLALEMVKYVLVESLSWGKKMRACDICMYLMSRSYVSH